MKNIVIDLLLVFGLTTSGCSDQSDQIGTGLPNTTNDFIWNIPKDQVHDGGPGKDGIPALLNPKMITANEATYLSDNSLVVGYKNGTDIRAYAHTILDWHEIINDKVGSEEIAIIYCPLTGTATTWGRKLNGVTTTFGVSGLLYNTNVIPYDRLTNSNWSQMRLDCVNGSLRETKAQVFQSVETTWKTWKVMYPDTKIISTETGFNRNYTNYPYGDYRTNHNRFLFPYLPVDERLPNKERVLGVIVPGKIPAAKVYRFDSFDDQIVAVQDDFNGIPLIVAGSKTHNFIVAFERKTETSGLLNFTATDFTQGSQSAILKDSEGNSWNIFGEAVSGPRQGETLKRVSSFIGYWFSWGAFYPAVEIFN